MTNLVINVFPERYCFEEANTNNRKLKPSYISKSDINKYGFQLFVLDSDIKEINKISEEDLEEYIERFEKSNFKSHYAKIKEKKDKTRRKKLKRK